jgi:hypothetical protein
MTLIHVCSFQNNSTKKYRLLCLESGNEGWCLRETSADLDDLPNSFTDVLASTVHELSCPATFADYEQERDHIVEDGYTIVAQQ